jgi:hypothetical protein
MKLRSVLYGAVLLTVSMLIGASARAESVNLNCTNGSDEVIGHVTFDEKAGTAGYSADVNNVPVSPAKFTDVEITWTMNSSYDGKLLSYALDRTTGTLSFKPSNWRFTCTVAKAKF